MISLFLRLQFKKHVFLKGDTMPSKIKKRGDSYLFTVSGGYRNGQQITYTKTVKGLSPGEIKKEYHKFELDCEAGKVMPSTAPRMTLAQFFIYWQDNYCKHNLAPTTVRYNEAIAARILAALGHLPIHKITSQHCLQLLEQLRQPAAGATGKPLSDTTIRKHYTLLNELMNFAVKWDFVPVNPLTKIDPPKKSTNKKELPTQQEVTRFLQLLIDETDAYKDKQKKRYIECLQHQLWSTLAFVQGLRTEEIFGLQRHDIDGDILHIRRAAVYVAGQGVVIKDTKSVTSARQLALSPITKDLLAKYIAETNAFKVASAERWIFTQDAGQIAHPQIFNRFLQRFCKRYNLPNITPHLLRHMHGSYLMRSGLDLAATAHQLGHTNKSFTADTYIHVTERVDIRAAAVMQGVIDGMIK